MSDTEPCGPPSQSIRAQVSDFHEKFGAPVLTAPAIPADSRVWLRAKLIAEEFIELLEALGVDARVELVQKNSAGAPMPVDLPQVAKEAADLDYVVEGTRLELGIDGAPVAVLVHESNMAKLGGEVRPDGKILKPPGWTPPDIESEMRRQGWDGKQGWER